MKHRFLQSWFSACIALLVMLPMALPLVASATGMNISSYLCNPSGQATSSEAEIQLIAFLTAVGEIDPADNKRDVSDQCSDCVMTDLTSISRATQHASPVRYAQANLEHSNTSIGFHVLATGPPLGGRAPPISL